MTLPDVRGCWKCKKSVPGKLRDCPHCDAPLIVSFGIKVDGVTETLDCPALTAPDIDIDELLGKQ